jgi:hypothetical protein
MEQIYPPLWVSRNLIDPEMSEDYPWDFKNDGTFDGVDKRERRKMLNERTTDWQVYTGVRALNPMQRVSAENPAVAIRAIIVDYDSRTAPDAAEKLINESLPAELRPNLMEVTLSDKLRLIWFLGRDVLIISPAHWRELYECFCKTLKLENLLAGYDDNSAKLSMCWTNGGEWFFLDKQTPLSVEFLAGIQIQAVKKESLFNHSDVPIAEIAAEQAARFPGRWQGDFEVGKTGVRFWDPKADNPCGCQVKPDGMVCFTGPVPFMPWDKIFGKLWCDERRILKLGNAAKGMYTDGHTYFEIVNGVQVDSKKESIITRLKAAGLSDKVAKGETQSEVGAVMNYIETVNRVLGAAPMINYPPGIVEIDNERILNLANLKPVQPVKPPRSFKEDAPFLHWFFVVHQCVGEGTPYLLYWMLRSSQNYRFYQRELGQAVFVCGPVNSGKTLLSMRIIAPMFGGKTANPMNVLMGETGFTDDQFAAGLLAVNDSDYPKTEGLRLKVLQGYKDYVVNPKRTYHPKFQKKLVIESVTRLFTTLNDGAGSAGSLPEVNEDTKDKFMFLRMKAVPPGTFPSKTVLEAQIARELPYFVWWLENEWECPEEILLPEGERTGCKSYYDPFILELSHTQTFSANLGELLKIWTDFHENFSQGAQGYWEGSPTELLSELQRMAETETIAKDWKQQSLARNLLALSKVTGSGVSLTGRKNGREFRIEKATPTHES